MASYYTNVQTYGSKILYRGVEDGVRVRRKLDYNPSLFLKSHEPTDFKTIHGEYLSEVKPGSMPDCRKFVETYKDVNGFDVYGNQRYEYAYICDTYPDQIGWDRSKIVVANIDIEVGSEHGFPEPSVASEPITAITYKVGDKFIVFGCGEFENKRDDVWYIKCEDEIHLLKRFLDEWSSDYPDVITGWHIKFFDVPYLVNRISALLGVPMAMRLSPWNRISERTVTKHDRDQNWYVISGIATLDYIELYKKYAPLGKSQESYTLNHICSEEIGEKKISYDEYGGLHGLYKKNYQLFIEYNIRDVELVEKLDDKLKLIDLALTVSYKAKCNYEDVFAQVRMWDSIIYNHLRKKNIIVPPQNTHIKRPYKGAYVKPPLVGMHEYVASFDLASMYPSLIMQYNISPDSFIKPENYTPEMRETLQGVSVENLLYERVDTSSLPSMLVAMTPNSQFFGLKKEGFLVGIIQEMFNDRVAYKKKYIQAQKDKERIVAEMERRGLKTK